MAVYVVSYDLIKSGKNHQPLYDALEKAGAKKIHLSQWVLKTNQTAVQFARSYQISCRFKRSDFR